MVDYVSLYSTPMAEDAVIGSIILGDSGLIPQLSADDFASDANRAIYEAARKLFACGTPVDLVTLCGENGPLPREYIERAVDASNYVPVTAHAEAYVRQVKIAAIRRKLGALAVEITRAAVECEDPERYRLDVMEQLAQMGAENRKQDTSLSGISIRTYQEFEDRATGKRVGGKTGLSDLDIYTGGFFGGEVIVVAARPANGKSAFALMIAKAFARRKEPVLFISREMSDIQLCQRLFQDVALIDGEKLNAGNLSESDWEALAEAVEVISRLPMHIDTTADTPQMIRAKCREMQRTCGIKLLVIDYIQLIDTDMAKGATRQEAVAKCSRAVKKIAMEFDIPVILLSQLNRASVAQGNRRPVLADIRESGAIEQDADKVLLLHKPDDEDLEDDAANLKYAATKNGCEFVECIIGKNRMGKTGVIPLAFMPTTMRWFCLDREGAR